MSLAEIKTAVDQLSPRELAELEAFIRDRDNAAWDRQIDEDFAETGRLRRVLDEVRHDARAGCVQELP
jgi:serine/threonine protein kinase HipA of HipAB toxin-antitoxin module